MKTLILLILFPLYINAQIGIKAGLNSSYFDKYHNYKSGFVGGLYANIGHGWLTIQPEVLYVNKGSHNDKDPGDWNFNTYYIQYNLLASINMGCVSVKAGAYAAKLLFASNTRMWQRGYSWSTKHWIYPQWDYGISAGPEVDLHGASIGFRYDRGLRQVVNDPASATGLYGAKNVCMNVYLSVPFKVK